MTAEALSLLALVLAASFYMVGLVWFVQRVQYPLLAGVGSQQVSACERAYRSRNNSALWMVSLARAGASA